MNLGSNDEIFSCKCPLGNLLGEGVWKVVRGSCPTQVVTPEVILASCPTGVATGVLSDRSPARPLPVSELGGSAAGGGEAPADGRGGRGGGGKRGEGRVAALVAV